MFPMRVTCPGHHIFFYFISLAVLGEKYKL
jgi:hypothetical protein